MEPRIGSSARSALDAVAANVRESLRLVPLAMRVAWGANPRLASGMLLLYLVQAALPLLELFLTGAVLDRAALDLGVAGRGAAGAAAALPLGAWIGLAAGTLAAGQLLSAAAGTLQELAGDRISGHVTERIIQAANRWPGLAHFESPAFADDLQRARSEASRAGAVIIPATAATTANVVGLLGLAGVLAGLHPAAPLVLAAGAVPQILASLAYNARIGSRMYGRTPEARRLEYSREVLLAPEPAKDVRLYDLAGFFRAYYDATFGPMQRLVDAERRRLGAVTATTALSAALLAAVYVAVVWLVLRGERTLGELAVYGGAATLFQSYLFRLNATVSQIPADLYFLPSLFRVLEAPPDLPLPARGRPAPRPVREGIRFEHVTFGYPEAAGAHDGAPRGPEPGPAAPVPDPSGAPPGPPRSAEPLEPRPPSRAVLRDISFTLAPGECVALVGHNGAGKTTIVKLLLRLYDPTSGRILLDGVDLREYDLADLRRQMGVVFQDYARFELTVAENIGVGQVDLLPSPPDGPGPDPDAVAARLLDAAGRAGADQLVASLPQGLHTRVGRLFGGRELSGGEWQKLALARAFVRESDLLVLDEPAASLDVQTEYDLYTRFRELTRGRTTVLITHRLSTVRMADRILYLEGGAIREMGSHDALLARGGEYARLYRLQASQYLTAAAPASSAAPGAGAGAAGEAGELAR